MVFGLTGRLHEINLSMQTLASGRQSEWSAHQQGGLFKVNEQDTLYSMCIVGMPHLMEF